MRSPFSAQPSRAALACRSKDSHAHRGRCAGSRTARDMAEHFSLIWNKLQITHRGTHFHLNCAFETIMADTGFLLTIDCNIIRHFEKDRREDCSCVKS